MFLANVLSTEVNKEKKLMMRSEKGFTLIEIIAVLVILGILAAVAIPKYVDMQSQARQQTVYAAIGALQSTAIMNYAQGLLNGTYNGTSGPANLADISVGDFTGSITVTGGSVNVTVTNGTQTGWGDGVDAANKTKTFTIHD